MCGISGIIFDKPQVSLSKYYQAHNKLDHRGPDDEGFYYIRKNNGFFAKGDTTIPFFKHQEHIKMTKKVDVVLGHKRLSIIDLSHLGHQPMTYKNWVITYNGEIFNYIEIREMLIKEGLKFQSETDTEVLKAFSFWGRGVFKI